MDMQIQLSLMSLDQYQKYSELSFSGFVEEAAKTSGEPLAVVRARVGQAPKEPTSKDLWLVILANEIEAGYLWIRLGPDAEEAFGYDIYLDPSFRGKGIGREVMLAGRKILQERAVKKLSVCVFSENLVARELYASLGFREIAVNDPKKQRTLEIQV